jgi:hypothetical protein
MMCQVYAQSVVHVMWTSSTAPLIRTSCTPTIGCV